MCFCVVLSRSAVLRIEGCLNSTLSQDAWNPPGNDGPLGRAAARGVEPDDEPPGGAKAHHRAEHGAGRGQPAELAGGARRALSELALVPNARRVLRPSGTRRCPDSLLSFPWEMLFL